MPETGRPPPVLPAMEKHRQGDGTSCSTQKINQVAGHAEKMNEKTGAWTIEDRRGYLPPLSPGGTHPAVLRILMPVYASAHWHNR